MTKNEIQQRKSQLIRQYDECCNSHYAKILEGKLDMLIEMDGTDCDHLYDRVEVNGKEVYQCEHCNEII